MAIEKYVTNALVLDAYDQGEHDRAYKLFTREFGLIICHAKSVRKLESKLRAHLLPRTISLVTVVKGREVWRLVGAEKQNLTPRYIHEATSLLKRFIRGEGSHKTLYDRILVYLEESSSYAEGKARLLLYYILLVELGYADAKVIGAKNIEEYISFSVQDLYTHLALNEAGVRKHVKEVLEEIQL